MKKIFQVEGYTFQGSKKECHEFISQVYKGAYVHSCIMNLSRPKISLMDESKLIAID